VLSGLGLALGGQLVTCWWVRKPEDITRLGPKTGDMEGGANKDRVETPNLGTCAENGNVDSEQM